MYALLLAIHVLSVVLWIGGVAFVTMIIFPLLTRLENSLEQVLTFQRIENRFAKLARFYVFLTGFTGILLLYETRKFNILFTFSAFHIWYMFFVWLLYTIILLFEKRFLSLFFQRPEEFDIKKMMKRFAGFHWFILFLSLFAIFIAVVGTHSF